MENPYRGEVELVIGGRRRKMKLTLGALAALEHALGDESILAVVQRFEAGTPSAQDIIVLLAAGLDMSAEEVARADIKGGPIAAARAAAQLLKRTFEIPDGEE